MSNHVSIKDLAQELGVSPSTISRALHDSKEISPAMRKKVKEHAQTRGYHPNPFAIGLRKNAPSIIGIVVPDIVTHFYSAIISGINDVARENGYAAIITSSYEQLEIERQCLQDLINIRVEGIVACASQETHDFDHFDLCADNGIPIVFFDRASLSGRYSCVVADNESSAYIATKHLIDCGATRIGFLGGDTALHITRERKHGYLQALKEHKIVIDKQLVICGKMAYKEGQKSARELLSQHPDAILAMNDTLTFAAMKEIKRQQLRIPQEIQLIGYTDELHSNFVEPALTAVTHHTYDIGTTACRLLLGHIHDRDKRPTTITIPTHLIVRQSTKT